jgi:hypothetical protein
MYPVEKHLGAAFPSRKRLFAFARLGHSIRENGLGVAMRLAVPASGGK